MASGQTWYGSLKPQYFILVDSAGARFVNHTFIATDVYLIVDGGTDIDISTECAHVSKGLYKWTPSLVSRTQREDVNILITDSAASTFVDNAMLIQTGGHASAYFDAGT